MEKNKSILVVCQHFWPEAFRINDISEFLIEKGCKIDVLCGIPNYPKGKFYEGYSVFKKRKQAYKGSSVRRVLEIPRGNNSSLRIFINYLSYPFFSLFHIPLLLGKKYDKIFLYQLSPVMMAVAGILVGKIKKVETTMYVLDLWPENLFSVLDIQNKLLRRLVTSVSHWHYRHVDKLVVLSEQMQDKLIKVTGKTKDKIIILPQACEKVYEEDVSDPMLQKKFNDTFNVLYTGNISPAQSFGTMIDAAKILKNEGYKDIHWVIVGDGMSRKEAEKLVDAGGVKDVFTFEGQKPVEAIPAYSDIADVLVGCLVKSPLLEATIPAKVLSYIASGKPIVLAMDGEVHKLVNNTIKCGFAGPTEDPAKLASNIKRIYNLSPVERKNMGVNARRYHFKYLERNIVLGKLYDFMFS